MATFLERAADSSVGLFLLFYYLCNQCGCQPLGTFDSTILIPAITHILLFISSD